MNTNYNILDDIARWNVMDIATEEVANNEDLAMYESASGNMKVGLVTDDLITKSKLKCATNQVSFYKGAIPTDDGIFSPIIFGDTPEEKKRTFGYIDLGGKFFHPYAYEILCALMPKKFDKCASGKGSWIIDKGVLTEITDVNSKDYDEDSNGVNFLIENFKKIKYTESGAVTRADRIKFITSLKENELFISKWLVIPVFYRDIDKNSATYKLPEIDVEYNNIIRYSNSLKDSAFSFFDNQTRYNIQSQLVAIRKRGQKLIEKKHGFFQKSVLGKSIDRGSRDVISTPTFLNCERPSDQLIDVFTTGMPLAKCLVVGYDFIMRYCLQFFGDNFRNMTKYPTYKNNKGVYEISGEVTIKDPTEIYNAKYIEKKIKRFQTSHETRFELIEIETEDGQKIPMHFTGQFAPLNSKVSDASPIINRPFTWTDLFYMAAYNTLLDKSMYITRYPIVSHNSIFPTKCLALSTIKTQRAVIDGVEYPNYPVIDLSPNVNISNIFNDTMTFSNLFLAALDGDYDGDMTSTRMAFTLEANKEAEDIALAVRSFVNPEGKLLRTLGNEAYLTFYSMTRTNPPAPMISKELKAELLNIKKEDLTVSSIAKLFGATIDVTNRDKGFALIQPKFNIRSKLILNPGEYTNKELVETTVGKFLFNKLMIEKNIDHIVPNGYINKEMNKKEIGVLGDIVAENLMNGVIKVIPHMAEYLKCNEFWGLVLSTIFAPSYSIETIVPNKALNVSKKKKLTDNKGNNSVQSLTGIEDELISEAHTVLKDTPGKILFDSGARGSFENDYKNMQISVGPVYNPITKQYDFMESSYIGGISKKDLIPAANVVVGAEYPKAIGTATGGYLTKKFYAVFQTLIIDEAGSDCGTKEGIKIILTKDNVTDYYDQYIIGDKGKIILIDDNLPASYFNREVKLRSPMYCLNDKFCNKCAGERFYKLGIDNIGLTSSAIGGKLMKSSLKLRHNMKIKFDKVDIDSLLL